MQWTTKPTEEGKYYWICRTNKATGLRYMYIGIMRITNDTEWYIDHGDESEFPEDQPKKTYQYYGPLSEPEPPKE